MIATQARELGKLRDRDALCEMLLHVPRNETSLPSGETSGGRKGGGRWILIRMPDFMCEQHTQRIGVAGTRPTLFFDPSLDLEHRLPQNRILEMQARGEGFGVLAAVDGH